MFIVAKVLSREKNGEKLVKISFYVILGFITYDLVTHKLIPKNMIAKSHIELFLNDTIQMITVALISRLLERKTLNEKSG